MGFTVTFYTLEKRDNSTKRPAVNGTDFECVLKHGSGILGPSISLNLGLTDNPSRYNYAYIPVYGRYYFITEWFWEDRLWTANLKVDVLATYKTEIGDANLYVLRSSAESDGRITDLLYPAKTGCSFQSITKPNPWQNSCYVIGVVSRDANVGSLKYYMTTASGVASLCRKLTNAEWVVSSDHLFDPAEFSEGLQLALADPLQYVKSCVMLPVGASELIPYGDEANIVCFNYETGVAAYALEPKTIITKQWTFTIPKHPDTNARGNYVNSAPFTNLTLTIPPFGVVTVDTSVTCGISASDSVDLNVVVQIDAITGKGVLIVVCENIILNRIEGQVGIPISLSSVTRDYIGGVTNTVGAVADAVQSGASAVGAFKNKKIGDGVSAIAGGVSGVVSGIGNAMASMIPRAQTVGTTGAFVSNELLLRLDCQFFRPIDDDNAHNGRPLCKNRVLKNLGGYMLIQDGDVVINGTGTEDAEIRAYLESGFYYE